MKVQDLNTKEENTWCPGCSNFGILQAFKEVIVELVNENKIQAKDVAFASGIGCHAKTFDYVNLNAFYGIHGRVLPICMGMKLGNPELKVIGFGGDGDTYAEGISHFVHACRNNADLTMIVHNNQVFSLTTGQATPTSEQGFTNGSTPLGVKERPLNPIVLALETGATFVGRAYALDIVQLKNILKQAILHKGFGFVDVLQPCIIYHNAVPYFQKNVYKLNHEPTDLKLALEKAREWDYCFDKNKKVATGVFYKRERPSFEKQWVQLKKPWYTVARKPVWQKITKEFK